MYVSVLYLLLISFITTSESAKILGAVFTPSYSHQMSFQPIWKELSLRGHKVTVLTTNPMNDSSLTNLTEIDLSMSYDIMKFHKTDELLSLTNESIVVRYKKYMDALHEVADKQLSHPKVQDLIYNKKDDFDLLMVEVIFPTQMALSWWFQIPFIGLVSLDAPGRIHSAVGNPVHPVLYPDYDLPFSKNLKFFERFTSTAFQCFMKWYTDYRLHPREEVTIKKHFGIHAPTINEIQKNMSLLFINANPVFHNIRPLGPSTIQIGGLYLNELKSLPTDIQEFLDNSIRGFIYFSLGTNVKSAALLDSTKNALLQAFSELPFNVLWKFEDTSIFIELDNIKIVQWVPQTTVLAHKNIKAFITQCGLQSMEEAIIYNVPMIGLPFYGDQGHNADILEQKQLGVKLDTQNLKKEDIVTAVLKVSLDASFKENLNKTAKLYSDVMNTGLERAIWWSEYVIRNGADHLRSSSIDVPLYQYLLLDIIAFTTGVIILFFYIITLFIKLSSKIITSLYRVLYGNIKKKKE